MEHTQHHPSDAVPFGPSDQARLPELVEWELTRACDLACQHCYHRSHAPRPGELDTVRALALAESLADAGCRSVTLSGGEPTLRSDLRAVCESLAHRGVQVQLFTHGQHLDRSAAIALRDAGVHFVFLSVDGLSATHDRIRNKPGAFDKVLRATDTLRSANLRYGFSTVVVRQNLRELERLEELVMARGADLWTVWAGIPQDTRPLWLRPRELAGLRGQLTSLSAKCPALRLGDNLVALTLRRPSADLGRGRARSWVCPAGTGTMGVRSDGTAVGCLMLGTQAAAVSLLHTGQGRATLALRSDAQAQHAPPENPPLSDSDPLAASGCRASVAASARHRLQTGHPNARAVATGLLALAAGCSAQPSGPVAPGPTPATPAAVVHVPATPAPSSSDADAEPEIDDPTLSPTTPGTASSSNQMPSEMPRCCMMHVLRPGCVCGSGSTP